MAGIMFKVGLISFGGGYVMIPILHWDVVDTWFPGAQAFIASSVGPGRTLVAIDEDTAMVGDGRSWRVLGRSGLHFLSDGAWTDHPAGARFDLPLDLARG